MWLCVKPGGGAGPRRPEEEEEEEEEEDGGEEQPERLRLRAACEQRWTPCGGSLTWCDETRRGGSDQSLVVCAALLNASTARRGDAGTAGSGAGWSAVTAAGRGRDVLRPEVSRSWGGDEVMASVLRKVSSPMLSCVFQRQRAGQHVVREGDRGQTVEGVWYPSPSGLWRFVFILFVCLFFDSVCLTLKRPRNVSCVNFILCVCV